jgi:hypothetical protein
MKYWEIIADNLGKAGWSWGCVSTVDSNGRTIWIADAHRDDGKRFVVHADEKLSAFLGTTSGDSSSARIVTKRRSRRISPRCSTQRAGIAPPHAAGEGLSGATSDGEFGFISGPAAFVGGVPLTRARNPWAMPEAST